MKKLCILLLLALAPFGSVHAQYSDHYSMLVDGFDKLLREQPELLFQDLYLRIRNAEKNNQEEKVAQYKYLLGRAYSKLGEKDEAKKALKSALKQAKSDSTSGRIHYELGNVYYHTGKYEDGIKHHNISIRHFKKLNRRFEQAASINSIGLIYDELKQYDEAMKYYRKALDIYLEQNDMLKASSVVTNIGSSYFMKDSLNIALEYFKRSYELKLNTEAKTGINASINNLGLVYTALGEKDSALYYLNKGVEINRSMDEKRNLCLALNALGKYYLDNDNPAEAISKYLEAESIAEEIEYPLLLSQVKWGLSQAYEMLGRTDAALAKLKEQNEIDDKLNATAQLKAVDKTLMKEKLRAQNALHQRELDFKERTHQKSIEKQDSERTIFIFAGIIFLIGLILLSVLFINLRRRSKVIERKTRLIAAKNERLNELMIAKEKIFSIIGHDLRGSISTFQSYLNLVDSDLPREELKEMNAEMNQKLEQSLNIMDDLVKLGIQNTHKNDVLSASEIHLEEIAQRLKTIFGQDLSSKQLSIELDQPDNFTIESDNLILETILRNLASNAIRHAKPGTHIELQSTHDATTCFVAVRNEGDEAPDRVKSLLHDPKDASVDTKGHNGFGLLICREFAEKLGGGITYKYENGKSTFTVNFPFAN